MSISKQIAKHLREVHFGGNWTTVNLKDSLKDLSWEQANKQVFNCNSIATLVYHTTYYVAALLNVLRGEPLNSKDELSFQTPLIQSQQDWETLLENAWSNAENAAELLEKLPDDQWSENFTREKHGSYFRNAVGIIEHMNYHLGQIMLLRKILMQSKK